MARLDRSGEGGKDLIQHRLTILVAEDDTSRTLRALTLWMCSGLCFSYYLTSWSWCWGRLSGWSPDRYDTGQRVGTLGRCTYGASLWLRLARSSLGSLGALRCWNFLTRLLDLDGAISLLTLTSLGYGGESLLTLGLLLSSLLIGLAGASTLTLRSLGRALLGSGGEEIFGG